MRHMIRLVSVVCLAAAVPVGCLSYASSASDGGAPGADAATAPSDATLTEGASAPNAGTVSIGREGGSPISPFAFGQNYWDWVDFTGGGTTGLRGTEALVGALHLNVIRAGGNNNDTNSPQLFDTAQIDKFVAYCRTVGAEPILQVPLLFNDVDGGAASPQAAADMVTYANGTKGYGIRYWEIGNEPDLYSMMYDAGTAPLNAADYCTTFKTYAAAMKSAAAAVDGGAAIQLLGPELSYQYVPGQDWLTPFLDGCKDYIDIVTIHRYPFSAAQTSVGGALGGASSLQSTLNSVGAIVKAHARPNTPLAITESNISYDYDQRLYTTPTSMQAAPGTFYAALWTADFQGVALVNNLWTLAFWNIGETSATSSVLGFIEGDQPVPAYYAQQMFSANFSGNVLAPLAVPAGFSVYASYDGSKASTAVVVLNKKTAPAALTLAIDTLPPQSFDFPATSMTLVQIPDAPTGTTHVTRYTADLAAAGMPPQMVQ